MKINCINVTAPLVTTNKNQKNNAKEYFGVQKNATKLMSLPSSVMLAQMPNISFGNYDSYDDYDDESFDAYAHSYELSEEEKNPSPKEYNRDDFDDDYAAYCSSCMKPYDV